MHDNKYTRTPIVEPLWLLLKSRRVLVALVSLALSLLVLAFPALASVQAEVLTLILALALALIGGYSLEDAVAAARQTPPPEDWRTELRETIHTLLDAALEDRDTRPPA